ncbi:hypothetical protein E2C01_074655 [Portunus trituberculatus]|uniref:Uncharacterized protein n=1 Tax=Portunus trituberculatus TaxID=210409 RepID=A0A5B7IGV0_PORTR|nr:hypothetical protein [Portunus trituberculatus]
MGGCERGWRRSAKDAVLVTASFRYASGCSSCGVLRADAQWNKCNAASSRAALSGRQGRIKVGASNEK